jgi:hypothetical protein
MDNPDPAAAPAPTRASSPLADATLAAFLEKSPTLRSGLAQLNRDGINVEWGAAGGGTYLVPGSKIVIDANAANQGGRIARSLSHEIGHHRFTEQPDQSSKQAFVGTLLRGEAAATLSNAHVRREIVNGGGPDIGISGSGDRPRRYQAIADQHLAGALTRDAALDQIAEIFKTERPSVGPHATYELYYGAHYDAHIAPRLRRQGNPEPTLDAVTPGTSHLDPADGRLYGQIRAGVETLDSKHDRQWDVSSERMTASLLVLAKEEGLSRVDHVVLNQATERHAGGERVFLVEGALNDPAQHRASMATGDAIAVSEAQSFARVESMNQARDVVTQQQTRSQSDAIEQAVYTQSASPHMR